MPRKTVLQYDCDRCGRTWYEDAPKEAESMKCAGINVALFGSDGVLTEAKFEMLCESCEKTVKNLVAQICKDLKHNSPKRGAKKKGQQDADPPSPSTPEPPKNGTPASSSSGTSAARPIPARSGTAQRG